MSNARAALAALLGLAAMSPLADLDRPSSNTGKGIRRVTSDSMAGRRMTQAKGSRIVYKGDDLSIPAEIRAHNEAIEAKRRAKLEARKQRKAERKK